MPKGGSSPSGTTTVVQNTANPTQTAQLPYLTGAAGLSGPNPNPNQGWNQAVNLAQGDPYQYFPGQTLANFDPAIAAGYQGLINSGYGNFNTANSATNAFNYGVSGGYGVGNSPAFAGLEGIANSNNLAPNINAANAVGNTAVNAAAYNPIAPNEAALNSLGNAAAGGNATAMGQLEATASGAYLRPNPYLAAEYQAAAQPVINAYQTATSPQTDSNFEASGRYGSGALANAQSQNQLNLGTTLGNLSANLYGQDYANERGLQVGGALSLGNLTNANNQAAQSAYGTAGQLGLGDLAQQNASLGTALSGYGLGGQLGLGQLAQQNAALGTLQSGFQAGNTAQNQALLMEPNVLSGNLEPNQAITAGGQGLTGISQAQINDAMQRFYGNQQAPWITNEQYLNQIGQPTSGSANTSTKTPYFTNGLANVLGAGVGGLGLFNGINSATGGSLGSGLSSALGGIFGGTGAADLAALSAASAGGTTGFLGDAFGGSLLGFLGAA